MTTSITPPLKWHGGKHYLAKKIIALMPPHVHYVEPFFGGGAVLLAKTPEQYEGVSEVVVDLNYDLTNFWCALQDDASFKELKRRLDATPFSQVEFEGVDVEREKFGSGMTGHAAAFFVKCRMSLAGRMKSFAPLSRTRTRRGMNEQASAWLAAIEGLPAVHDRLKRVVILNAEATKIMLQQDGPDTLFCCDPPYLPTTRTAPDVYAHEMTVEQHVEFLCVCNQLKGKVLVSGYRCDLYDTQLADWTRHDFELPNNAAGGESKRRMVECVWCNFATKEAV